MLDLLIAAAILAGAVHGFTTGAIKQIASLAGIVVSFVLALNLMHSVGAALYRWIGAAESLAPLVGFIAVFAFVQIAIVAGVKVVEKIVGALKLGSLNRLAGSGVGAAKAALALSVAFLVLGSVGFPRDEAREESRFYPMVASFLPTAWDAFSSRTGINSLSDVFDYGAREEGRN